MRSLPAFALTRLLSVAAVMVAIAVVAFLVSHGLRPEAFPDARPLPAELLDYLRGVFLHLDFGRSNDPRGTPVADILSQGLGADVSLLAGALVLGSATGVAAGAFCAAHPGTLAGRALQGLATLLLCAPVYWVGLLVILGFDSTFGYLARVPGFSTNNYQSLAADPLAWAGSLIAPWIVLGAPLFAYCLRLTRATMGEALDADFLRTAHAKGLDEGAVLRRHALPAAASPVVALVGVNMATLVTNMVLVENVFSVPGAFQNITDAVDTGDFALIQGLTIVAAAFVAIGNLAADLIQARLDPLVRLRSR